MIVWTPDSAETLIEAQEDQTHVSATVRAEAEADPEATPPKDDPVVAMTWKAVPPLPSQVVVVTTADTLTITFPNFIGMFPIQEIRYLRHGAEEVCQAWADLPGDAEDVIAYRPHPANQKDILLTITACQKSGAKTSADFVIQVFANYTLGRKTLMEAVNARRR